MATHRIPVSITGMDATVFPARVSSQIASAATPSVGDMDCYVMNDGGADEGVYGEFDVPKNYVGTPKLVIRGYLDGTPGASETLGFACRKRAVANNESADGTFDAEQTVSATIGSSGSNHADEDFYEASITLTAGDFAVDDAVNVYAYIDASGTTYAGNFLLRASSGIFFEYADV